MYIYDIYILISLQTLEEKQKQNGKELTSNHTNFLSASSHQHFPNVPAQNPFPPPTSSFNGYKGNGGNLTTNHHQCSSSFQLLQWLEKHIQTLETKELREWDTLLIARVELKYMKILNRLLYYWSIIKTNLQMKHYIKNKSKWEMVKH